MALSSGMRASPLVILLLQVSACGRSSGPPNAVPSVANTASASAKLQIPHSAPRIGSIRTETIHVRDPALVSRRVKRSTVLAVDGLAATKVLVKYFDVMGDHAVLAGKSFMVSFVDGKIDVVPADGTPPGDEAAAAAENSDVGTPDATTELFTGREFQIGIPTNLPMGPPYPPEAMSTQTLRSFDATTATFDVMMSYGVAGRMWGSFVVDRATGAERSMSVTFEMREGGKVDQVTVEKQTTIEAPR